VFVISSFPGKTNFVRAPAAIFAALVIATTCSGAADGASGIRFGIQDDAWLSYGPGTLESRLDTLNELGVQVVRFTIQWNEVAPTKPEQPKWSGDPAYRWGSSDAVLKGLRDHGIDALVELRFTPWWANGGGKRNAVPLDGDDFANFATAVQNRFPWVHEWLIWNEPNKPLFLDPLSPKVYVERLLNPAYAALHAGDRNAKVGGGITGPRAGPGGINPIDWIRGMDAAGAKLDAYAHNPYPEHPQTETPNSGACKTCKSITMASLDRLLREVRKAWPGKRIWLTEYAYQTNPPDKQLGVSYDKAARYIGESGLKVYDTPLVDILIHFIVRDDTEAAGWQSGFMTVQGKRKPTYNAWRFPLAQASRKGANAKLWGMIRPGKGPRTYQLQVRKGGWKPLGKVAKTNSRGVFTRTVALKKGTQVRLYSPKQKAFGTPIVLK